ncbi:site-specific integrase [Mucilaginibacter sp. X4EP1]|uniref:site-specific integrase n=1 Tax=Mucilaginibacter sp. X4EP1 TaxID=2723092 RepID=UPI00216973CE|nr:site-specific integrase [Mucilaginibacter sp. X4EP1]MCS3812144.1 site-specific recombinase XerD [Mucilaginibacter sp. X4EP1]
MLEKSFGLFYYLKQAKNQKEQRRYVYLRITVDGERREISIKRQWISDLWNTKTGRAREINEEANELNWYLDTISNKVHQIKRNLIDDGKLLTAENIKNILTGRGEKKYFILEAFQEHNRQMKALIGKEFAPATLTRYKTACAHLSNYIKWKYQKNDFEIKDLNYEFISQFVFWLKSERKCGHNASIKYLGNFKKIVLECMKRGLLTTDPFLGFKSKRNEVIPVALTKEELIKITNKKFDIERLDHVRDIFLFSCYTGLAYIDAYKLRSTDIVIGIDGGMWITTTRQKTNSSTRLPLLPNAIAILAKYQDHPKCASKGTVLPVLTNQKTNSYLKEIADLCGIGKKLTFHIARHTFATTVTLTNGVPIETVSKMLGHKSLKQTQHYAKIVDLKISEDMNTLRKKLEMQM